jgi:hypothetical protein
MFGTTVIESDGTASNGTCSAAHATSLLQAAVQRGYRVEATRRGGAVITRDVWTGGTCPGQHAVTLEPVTRVGVLTDQIRRDLGAIGERTGRSPAYLRRDGRIYAGLYAIPPAAARRLLERGLITAAAPGDGRADVAVSLQARLALLAADHRTSTREPRRYVRHGDIGLADLSAGLNKPGRRGGKICDRTSGAWCSCGAWSVPAGDRESARMLARGHREEATAAMVRHELPQRAGSACKPGPFLAAAGPAAARTGHETEAGQ